MGQALSQLFGSIGLDGNNNNGYGQKLNGYVEKCCDGVVDPLTLVAVLAAIAGGTIALRQVIIDSIATGGRRKRSELSTLSSGDISLIFSLLIFKLTKLLFKLKKHHTNHEH